LIANKIILQNLAILIQFFISLSLNKSWYIRTFDFCIFGNNCFLSLSKYLHSKRYIESNTSKSARQGNLRHPRVRFQSFADEARWVSKRLKSYPRVSEISLSCTFCRCLILFLTFISSCVLFDSYVLLADDHVNNVSYFPFMSIKKVIPYFCVLREGYYVIIWLIVRICVFIKDWKLIYSELFILKRKSMENSRGSWHKLYSMYLPVKHRWFFLSCTSAR
jgi:hypothetical protein